MTIDVALIGVGRWGKNHARVLSSLKGLIIGSLVIVDSNRSRAKLVAEKYGADSYYSSVEDLVKYGKNLDAAIIAVPTLYHYRIASQLINYYDLFIEKPLAANLEEGLSLLESSVSNGRTVAVGHIERFNPIVNVALQIAGSLGEILEVSATRLGPGPARNYTLNLGVAHDLLVHDVDISVLFLGKKPRKVFSFTFYSENYPYETEILANYMFEGGAYASLLASWRTTPNYKHRSLSIRFDNAVITVDYILRRIIINRGIKQYDLQSPIKAAIYREEHGIEISYLQEEPLKLELLDFLNSVQYSKKPRVSILDGYIALKCIIKALEAAEKERMIDIFWDELEKYE